MGTCTLDVIIILYLMQKGNKANLKYFTREKTNCSKKNVNLFFALL